MTPLNDAYTLLKDQYFYFIDVPTHKKVSKDSCYCYLRK